MMEKHHTNTDSALLNDVVRPVRSVLSPIYYHDLQSSSVL